MVEIILAALSILGPLMKWGIEKILKSGKVEGEAKKRLEDAYVSLSRIRRADIKKARELERELPKMDEEMKDIKDGKKPWPNESPES